MKNLTKWARNILIVFSIALLLIGFGIIKTGSSQKQKIIVINHPEKYDFVPIERYLESQIMRFPEDLHMFQNFKLECLEKLSVEKDKMAIWQIKQNQDNYEEEINIILTAHKKAICDLDFVKKLEKKIKWAQRMAGK